jgi:hypothetical protein
MQNTCNSSWARTQLEHPLTWFDHASQHGSRTAAIGVNIVGVTMFYHWTNNIMVFN